MLTHRNISTDIATPSRACRTCSARVPSTVLFLPLAHSFARLIQAGVVPGPGPHRCTRRTPSDLVETLEAFQPTFVLAVPRVFEKVYNAARQRAHADGKGAIFDRAERVAIAYSEALRHPLGPRAAAARAQHALFDRLVYGKLRAALGGRCDAAISGGAPLGDPAGPLLPRHRDDRLRGVRADRRPRRRSAVNLTEHIRIGTVGRPLPGVTIRIADDGEILVARRHRVRRLLEQPGGDRRGHRRRGLVPHRRPGQPRRRRLPVDHRPQEGDSS